jgi:hypothetical protein
MFDDADLVELVAKIHGQSFRIDGIREATTELGLGLCREVNRTRIKRLMRVQSL